MIGLLAAASAQVAALLLVGTRLDVAELRWAAVPAGLAIGAASCWGYGRVAYRWIERRSPQLLTKLRGGRTEPRPGPRTPPPRPRQRRGTLASPGRTSSGWCPGCASAWAGGPRSPLACCPDDDPFGWHVGHPVDLFSVWLPEPLPVPSAILLAALGLGIFLVGVCALIRSRALSRRR